MNNAPFQMDHYTYINTFLKDDESKLEAGKVIEASQKNAIVERLRAEQERLRAIKEDQEDYQLALANIEKIRRVLEMLEDEGKKNQYDTGLMSSQDSSQCSVRVAENETPLLPLVPIEKIHEAFDAFKQGLINAEGSVYKEEDFKYEKKSNPDGSVTHVFTFKDEETLKKFLDHLFKENMAMFSNGSQDIKDFPTKPTEEHEAVSGQGRTSTSVDKQQQMREQLQDTREGVSPPPASQMGSFADSPVDDDLGQESTLRR